MFTIFKINDQFLHDCTFCGVQLRYTKYQQATCPYCKTIQRVETINPNGTTGTSLPARFLVEDKVPMWRTMYHFEKTNLDLNRE